MECVLIFGLFFLVSGISSIVTKHGVKVFSKDWGEVTGSEAVTNGIIAVILGLIMCAAALYDMLT